MYNKKKKTSEIVESSIISNHNTSKQTILFLICFLMLKSYEIFGLK